MQDAAAEPEWPMFYALSWRLTFDTFKRFSRVEFHWVNSIMCSLCVISLFQDRDQEMELSRLVRLLQETFPDDVYPLDDNRMPYLKQLSRVTEDIAGVADKQRKSTQARIHETTGSLIDIDIILKLLDLTLISSHDFTLIFYHFPSKC